MRLTFEILGEARLMHQRDPNQPPIRITLGLAETRAAEWMARLSRQSDEVPLKQSADGCVAYFASGAYQQWPSSFMSRELPKELLETTYQFSLKTGPAIDFTSLLRKEIDYGPMQTLSRETWLKFSWAQVLHAFVLWIGLFFAAYFLCLHYFYDLPAH